ncbi:multidrug resistance ABC transporter ATP-binding protein/permease [Mycoavidus cysteinexigens]|uniref:Multidrug resistance ABC transporter ATP-binding protein/permease n=1 Tax=Mycoavidus cysteinexigens TaxID=1553431 RepID=A0A2Z6EV21_9BURK|nr:ABC transporter ATP-binding protein [Mycoavidus cysteinexigens]BBE09294.1 multidrug resistance ABC transporter ATP-binding protein/permease [Mycoavidus cysteinexigens]GAM51948.1 ATP-binding protein of ABC transporter [bacterium endosymbiont of Mortierella elongata FMR23-6]GLR02048.1 ABC transporter ATP-binding protein/permease [Mycoavidus cysteinexigens]
MKLPKAPKVFKALRFLLRCLWTHERYARWQVIAATGCTGFSIGLAVVTPVLLKLLIDDFSNLSTSSITAYLLCIAYGCAWFFSQALRRSEQYLVTAINERVKRTITVNYVSQVLNRPAAALSDHQSGASASEVSRAQDSVMRALIGIFWHIAPLCIEICLACIVVFSMFGAVYALVLLGFLSAYLYSTTLTTSYYTGLQRKKNLASDQASTFLIDTLTHADTAKAFSSEAGELVQLDRAYQAREQASVQLARKMEIFGVLQLLIVGIGLTTLTSLACRDIFAQRLTVGDFALLNGYLLQFTLPLSSFGYAIREARLGLFNLEELLDKLTTRWDFKSTSPALFERAPSIQFKRASFSHAPGKYVLREASFSVPAGAFCAIVGPTGAGKSTLMKLLLRLYSLESGEILIDGRPIESFSEGRLRQSVSYATQDAHLLDRSLRDNICFACPQASDAELARAISTAALTPVIAAAKAGLETQIGERGNKLSGGERQRVTLARALLRQSHLLLLDEPTAALDGQTEATIFKHLHERYRQTTRLVIAHRLSAIQHADLILVLKDGVIAEQGTHDSLLAQNGIYASLWHKQVGSPMREQHQVISLC